MRRLDEPRVHRRNDPTGFGVYMVWEQPVLVRINQALMKGRDKLHCVKSGTNELLYARNACIAELEGLRHLRHYFLRALVRL